LPVAEEAYLEWAAANPAPKPRAIEAGPTPAPAPTWLPAEEHPAGNGHHGDHAGHASAPTRTQRVVVHQPTSVIDPEHRD
jgi:hypothetical protein